MGNSALTNVVVAKRGAIISGSPVTTIVDTVNAEGVTALSKCHLAAILPLPPPLFFSSISYLVVWFVTCAKQKECQHSRHLEYLSLANVMLLYVSLPFTSSNRPLLVFTLNMKVEIKGILILYGSFAPERCGSVNTISAAAFTRGVARVASCWVDVSRCKHPTDLYRIFYCYL